MIRVRTAAPPAERINTRAVQECVRAACRRADLTNGTVTVVFVGSEELRTLKRSFFGEDAYTDVISFRLDEGKEPVEGEIYLCLREVEANAKRFRATRETELARVIIHGVLHLGGRRDDTPIAKRAMRREENAVLRHLSPEHFFHSKIA